MEIYHFVGDLLVAMILCPVRSTGWCGPRTTDPDLDAKLFFDPAEIQAAYLLNKTLPPPAASSPAKATASRA
jgi:hypothetical protein